MSRNDRKLKDFYRKEWGYDRDLAEKRLRKVLEEEDVPLTPLIPEKKVKEDNKKYNK